MIFSVTYYLELRNRYIYLLYNSFFITIKGRIGCLDIMEHQHLYLVQIYINSNKI